MKIEISSSFSIEKKECVALLVDQDFSFDAMPSKLAFVRTIGNELYFRKLKALLFIPSNVNPDLCVVPIKTDNGDYREQLRLAGAALIRAIQARGNEKVKLVVPAIEGRDPGEVASLLSEGAMIGSYSFRKYQNKGPENGAAVCNEVVLVNLDSTYQKQIDYTMTLCENVNLCRDMVNDITEEVNPDTIEKSARALGRRKGVSCQVLKEGHLKSKKMGLILAVGRAGRYRPRLIIMSYKGNPSDKEWTALVGKGVTFDSGGLDLKSAAGILDMRYDMAGAATVFHAFKAAVDLGLKKNIYAVMPLVENAIDSESYKPGDIFTSYAGKTVQIKNTDAEGRLILADALAYTEKVLKPKQIIDVATLTGACLTTFGYRYCGLLANVDHLAQKLEEASALSGERIWRLPLDAGYEKMIRGDIADLNNIGGDKKAGTITAAAFLKQFVGETSWAHLDIASTGWMDSDDELYGKYATGFGVRLLVEFLRFY